MRDVNKNAGMELMAWRNFEFYLPRKWEMLQFSRNLDSGRCAFADRAMYRFELNWRRVDGRPDFGRMLSDYTARLVEQGMEHPGRIEAGEWCGIQGVLKGKVLSRFGLFSERESCVVEFVFIWPGERDAILEGRVLESFRESGAPDEGMQRWRAFGMDVEVPMQMRLDDCVVEPAYAMMVFGDRRGRAKVSFSRRGMVEDWLLIPLDAWLAEHARTKLDEIGQLKVHDDGGHKWFSVEGTGKRGGVFEKKRPGSMRGWICPSDGRLYSSIGTGDLKSKARLKCCEGFRS